MGLETKYAQLLKKETNGKITGVDPSPERVSQAGEKLRGYPNVKLLDGEVSNLPPEQVLGSASLLPVLHFLPDDGAKLQLLKDTSSWSQPGGKWVILGITGNPKEIRENLQVLKFMIPSGISDSEVAERMKRIEQELFHIPEQRLVEPLELADFQAPLRFFQTSIYMGWITIDY